MPRQDIYVILVTMLFVEELGNDADVVGSNNIRTGSSLHFKWRTPDRAIWHLGMLAATPYASILSAAAHHRLAKEVS